MSVRRPSPRAAAWILIPAAAAALAAGFLTACAPSGFVETTANVIDEMTAFRQARAANTREAWQRFIDQYPDSSKAEQAKRWLDAMPENGGADDARMRAEVAKAEAERRARVSREEEVRRRAAAAQAELEQEREAQAAEQAKAQALAQQVKQVQAAPAASPQVAVSTQAAALLAELQQRMAELDKREAALKAKEAAFAAQTAAPAAAADDVDAVPVKGLPQGQDNFAVVIGVSKYRDIGAEAEYAERDARTMMLYLRDYLGYPEQNIKLLIGDRASQTDFKKILELWLPLQVTKDSKVFVYFSGHGAPDPQSQQAYLLPWDGDPKALDLTAYPLSRLYAKLDALPAKDVTVALDSCFSGAGGRSVIAQGARPLITHVKTGMLDKSKNVTVFAAAKGDEITGAYDPQKHGLFTYYFLRGLRGDADADKDGWVTVAEEYDYVKKNVSIQANRDSREQTPELLPPLDARKGEGGMRLAKVAQ
jgi:hypothetical protein